MQAKNVEISINLFSTIPHASNTTFFVCDILLLAPNSPCPFFYSLMNKRSYFYMLDVFLTTYFCSPAPALLHTSSAISDKMDGLGMRSIESFFAPTRLFLH